MVRFLDDVRVRDPDRSRLRAALRATSTAVVSTLALTALAARVGQPSGVMLVGIFVATLATMIVQEPNEVSERWTMLLVPLPAAASIALATLLAPIRWASLAGLLAVVFLTVAVRRFGPRGVALGMVAFQGYFICLVFRAPPERVPWMILSVVLATLLAFAIRFTLVREDRARLLARTIAAYPRAVGLVVERLFDLSRTPVEKRRRANRRVDRAMRRVGDVALLLDRHLEEIAPLFTSVRELRARAFALELATEELVESVRAIACTTPSPEVQKTVGALLAWAAGLLLRRPPAGAEDRPLRPPMIGDARELEPVRDALRAVLDASDLSSDDLRTREDVLATSAEPAPTPPEPRATRGLEPTTRTAIQATLASLLAVAAGLLVSPVRFYWAVIGAFIMFTRVTTAGEMVVRGWHRVVGTTAGVLAGLAIAYVIAGHRAAELALVFGSVFFIAYWIRVAYAWTAAMVTVMLAALYALLGRFGPEVLLLRFEETLVGCLVGAAVAIVVLPTATSDKVRESTGRSLRALAALLDSAARAGPSGAADPAPRLASEARALDRELDELHTATRPAASTLFVLVARESLGLFHHLRMASFFARRFALGLARLRAEHRIEGTAVASLEAHARALAAAARALAGRFEGDTSPMPVAERPCADLDPATPSPAKDALHHIERALVEVAHGLDLAEPEARPVRGRLRAILGLR